MANAILRPIDSVRREGLTVLHDPEDCELDLIIVHGLNGHPRRTFYDDATKFYWPVHLATSLPTARIMVFGYVADFSSGSSNVLGVYQHGESLLLHLKNNRIGSTRKKRPLVLLGHSLGGLVLKQALVLSAQSASDSDVLAATKLVCFLGTPHRGSHLLDKSFSKFGLSVMKLASVEVPKNVKTMLQPRGNESFIVNTEFMRIKGQRPVVNFYEQVPHPLLNDLVVDKDSAVFDSENSENIPVARDHEHLVRFKGSNDDAYHMLCQTLQRKIAQFLGTGSKRSDDSLSDRMMRACLSSLGTSVMSRSLSQSQEPHRKTLSWLWKKESSLLRWLQQASGLFVVTGKPGSGKSFLMSEVAKHVRRNFHNEFSVIVQHAFNARGTPRERSIDGFLRSTLVQILRQYPASFEAMRDCWHDTLYDSGLNQTDLDGLNGGQVSWSVTSLKRALLAVVAHVSEQSRLCFIVDALDECDESMSTGMDEIVLFFGTLAEGDTLPTKKNVSICLSRRTWPDISNHHTDGGFRMEEQNEPDITAYINDRWPAFASLASVGDEMKQLKAELIRKAEGIFLWAHLALERIQEALQDGATVTELQEAVNDIPKRLEGVFALLLGSINPKFSVESNRMLAIVLAAQRPLDLREFRFAMAASMSDESNFSFADFKRSQSIVHDDATMRRRILSRCGGLLEVKAMAEDGMDSKNPKDGQTNIVQFMHQSVRDYLLNTERPSASHQADALALEGHESLARCSIQYLVLEEVQQLASHLTSMGHVSGQNISYLSSNDELLFLNYATEYCFHHCEAAEQGGILQADPIEKHFGSDDRKFDNYVSLFNMIHQGEKHAPGYSLLHLAVERNLASFVDIRLTHVPADVNVLLEGGQSSVQVAVSRKHLETLTVLLKHNANVNLPVSYSVSYAARYDTPFNVHYRLLPPLVEACKNGSMEMVNLLLEHGADVSECTVSYAGMHVNQALLAAAYSGNIQIVQKLLDWDPVALSHIEIRLNAVVGLRDRVHELTYHSDESTTLRIDSEAKRSIEDDVQMMRKISELIFEGIKITELQSASASLPQFWYLTGCHHEVLERLRDAGTDFSGADNIGFSFFHAACFQGTVASVRLLQLNGGDATIPFTIYGWSCLQLALQNDSPAVLECLLREINLPIDDTDNAGNTALHNAARRAGDEFIHLLIANGADKSLVNFEGALPFHRAIYNRKLKNQIDILEKLLNDDSDVNLPDRDGMTPLHMAAECGAVLAFEWLLNIQGASIEPRDESGRTVYHLAASCRTADSTDILEILLDNCGQNGASTPDWGAKGAAAIDINERDSAGMTPLHHIFWTYDSRLMGTYDFDPAVVVINAKLLLRHGADLSIRDNSGNTPLHFAAWRGVKELVRIFLRAGADVHAMDENGLRPLDLAELEDVRELLEDAMSAQNSKKLGR